MGIDDHLKLECYYCRKINLLKSKHDFFNLTALTRETPLIQRKAKTRTIFLKKTFENFTLNSFIVSTFILLSRFSLRISSRNTALQNFKKKAMAETNSQFNFDENQEMETQPIFLSSDESEIDSPGSSPIPQLPNNVPDTYSAITQLLAAHHEQMSLYGTSAPQYPITPPTSLISDDEDDDMLTPKTVNPPPISCPIHRSATPSLFNYASK